MKPNPAVAVENVNALFALMDMLADPSKFKAQMAELATIRDAAVAEQGKLAEATSARDAVTIAQRNERGELDKSAAQLATERANLQARERDLADAKAALAAEQQRVTNDQHKLNQSVREHKDKLAEFERMKSLLTST